MEKIISRVSPVKPEAELQQLKDFINSIKHLPIAEAEREIAEKRFRKPIVIFNAFAIRPFWRDGRKAPPLPMEWDMGPKGKGSSFIVKGH